MPASLSSQVSRRWLLAAVLGCGLALPSLAADQGMKLLVAPPPRDGKTTVQVEVTEPALQQDLLQAPPSADSFRAAVEAGGAKVTAVRRMVPAGEASYTVLAFDSSGSFAAHWRSAFTYVQPYARRVGNQASHTVAVMAFGQTKQSCEGADATALDACLRQAWALGARQKVTRLKSYIQDAVREASTRHPLSRFGSREVIVFTDGGDESDVVAIQAVIDEARDLGVRVHLVCFVPRPAGANLAKRLDEMKQLAEGTGGRYLQVEDLTDPAAAIAGLADALDHLYWLEIAYCGVPEGRTSDQLALELVKDGSRVAWADLRFRQSAEGAALAPCTPTLAVPPALTAPPEVTEPLAPVRDDSGWWWYVLAGALFGMLLVLALRRRPAPVAKVHQPLAVAPAPVAAPLPPPPEPAPAPWRDPFASSFPETHLVPVLGPLPEPFYRIHRSPFTVGSSGDASLRIDLPQISSRHATLTVFPLGNVYLQDDGSTNGTYLDEVRLSGGRVQVKPGQLIGLSAQVKLRLVQPAAEAPAEPPKPVEPGPAKTVYAPVKEEGE